MRIVKEEQIISTIENMFIEANCVIPEDISDKLEICCKCEIQTMSKKSLEIICENNRIAKDNHVPICQDTGMAIIFAKIGMDVHIDSDKSFSDIVNEGVRRAYVDGYLRLSVVRDPLNRVNTNDNTPAIIYTELVQGDKIELLAIPKGFGSENMSRVKMFNPTATADEIVDFIVDTVKVAGSNPCPPVIVGVGIGGTFDYCTVLSKKALSRPINQRNANPLYEQLEEKALEEINKLDIGPQGFSGKTTALSVNIETYPTHIAGLPVAVNICCHVSRHVTTII